MGIIFQEINDNGIFPTTKMKKEAMKNGCYGDKYVSGEGSGKRFLYSHVETCKLVSEYSVTYPNVSRTQIFDFVIRFSIFNFESSLTKLRQFVFIRQREIEHGIYFYFTESLHFKCLYSLNASIT